MAEHADAWGNLKHFEKNEATHEEFKLDSKVLKSTTWKSAHLQMQLEKFLCPRQYPVRKTAKFAQERKKWTYGEQQ